jgi:predicted glycosyltransferase
LVDTIDSTDLTPESLAAAALRALARGRRTTTCDLALDGYARVTREVARVLPVKPAPPTILRELSA